MARKVRADIVRLRESQAYLNGIIDAQERTPMYRAPGDFDPVLYQHVTHEVAEVTSRHAHLLALLGDAHAMHMPRLITAETLALGDEPDPWVCQGCQDPWPCATWTLVNEIARAL